MIALVRTAPSDPRFRPLVAALDADLRHRYGALQDQYSVHNGLPEDTATVLALLDDVAAGCGCFRPFDATSIEIKRMWVQPSARRAGVARAVLGELERWARERGYTHAVLETGNLQPEAIALYQRYGFVEIPPYGPYTDLSASICMRKPL